MLDLGRLRLLRELHHRGTIAAVAAALSYSPSTVSRQLGELQREAGVVLFERSGRRLRLTGASPCRSETTGRPGRPRTDRPGRCDQNRSRFITLSHAATKSFTNSALASSLA
jgi:DNA-binding transcriptional ArsR family regulator